MMSVAGLSSQRDQTRKTLGNLILSLALVLICILAPAVSPCINDLFGSMLFHDRFYSWHDPPWNVLSLCFSLFSSTFSFFSSFVPLMRISL